MHDDGPIPDPTDPNATFSLSENTDPRVRLARHLTMEGRYQEAEVHLRGLLRQIQQTIGPEHHDSLGIQFELARVLQAGGQLNKALNKYRCLEEKQKHTLGSGHPQTLITLDAMAGILQTLGRPRAAEAEYRLILTHSEINLGAQHSQTISAHYSIAKTLAAQERHAEAVVEYQNLFSLLNEPHATRNLSTQEILEQTSIAMASQRTQERRILQIRELIDTFSATKDDHASEIIDCRMRLAEHHYLLGSPSTALAEYESILETTKSGILCDPGTWFCISFGEAQCHLIMKNYAEALKQAMQAGINFRLMHEEETKPPQCIKQLIEEINRERTR